MKSLQQEILTSVFRHKAKGQRRMLRPSCRVVVYKQMKLYDTEETLFGPKPTMSIV